MMKTRRAHDQSGQYWVTVEYCGFGSTMLEPYSVLADQEELSWYGIIRLGR